jgi:hypothetical protein
VCDFGSSSGKVTVEELLRTFISGVFSSNSVLQVRVPLTLQSEEQLWRGGSDWYNKQGVCLGKMDELLQMHSSPTSILGPMSDEGHTFQRTRTSSALPALHKTPG